MAPYSAAGRIRLSVSGPGCISTSRGIWVNRVCMRFRDAANVVRGATSAALRTTP